MTSSVRIALAAALGVLALGFSGCAPGQSGQISGPPNTLTAAERSAGWRLLFDGRSLAAWRGYKQDAVPAGWVAVNDMISKDVSTGDIVTRDQFGDFDLELEWKLGTGGNAGIFYRATEEYEHVYWSAPEFQLLDDANAPDGANRLTSAGAAYGLYPPPAGVVKPANEWNTARIVVRGNHVEHWLNGQKLLEYELGGADWQAKVRASKFAAWPNYGKAARGYIAIQGDHDGTLALRNIRIREFRSGL
ncbi:MAG: DUF1080 domain-containing protein [Gemmatimonadota bacterium]